MKQIALSIEQMNHLKELGVDTSDASLYWVRKIQGRGNDDSMKGSWYLSLTKDFPELGYMHFEVVPTYTLQDILEKLKLIRDEHGVYYSLEICSPNVFNYNSAAVGYLIVVEGMNYLDTAYNMLCWVAENYPETLRQEDYV